MISWSPALPPPGATTTGTQLDDDESEYQNGNYLNFQKAYTNNIILAIGSEQSLAERDIVMLYTRTQNGSGTISIEIGVSSSGPWTNAQTFTINNTASDKNYTIPTGVVDITHVKISAGDVSTPANSANNVYLSAVRFYDYDCVSRAPRATDDNITILEDLPTDIPVIANDYDPNGLNFVLKNIITSPSHGHVSINTDGTITYVNTTDYSGTDSFTYQVCNDSGYCSTATVTITIVDDGCSSGSYKPTSGSGTITKIFQYQYSGTNAATANSTSDNFPDSYIKQDRPKEDKGGSSAKLEVGKIFSGTKAKRALFSFNVSEIPSDAIIQTATFSALRTAGDAVSQVINLHQVTETWTESKVTWNLAYSGHNWTSAGGTFGSVLSSTTVLANGRYYWDVLNSVQAWVSGSSSNYGVLLKTGETIDKKHVFASREDGTVSKRPSLTVTYVVPALCESIPNRNPLANPDYSETYSSAADTIAVLDNDTDPDGNSISISGIGTVTHGSAVISGNNIIFTPTYGYNGIGTVVYTIKDNGSGELTDQSTIYVQIKNAPTVAIYDVDSVDSNDELVIYVIDNDEDPEGQTSTISQIVTQPSNGTVEISGNTLVFNPYPNFTGRDSLVYEVCETYVEECDATTLCDTAIVYITINNRPPEIVSPLIDTVVPCFCSVINLHNYVSDPEEGSLTFTIVSGPTPPGGGKAGSGTLENNGDGTVSYTPPVPLNSLEYITFTFAVTDNGTPAKTSDTVEVTFRIVAQPNQPPVANDDEWLDAAMNTDANIGVMDNDYDPEGFELSKPTIISQPLNGSAEILPNGLLRYTPDYQFYGNDSLIYVIHDTVTPDPETCSKAKGTNDTAKVRITINYDPDQFLPVSLVLYEAKCNNGITEIDWATVSESNNDYFVIERSKDLVSFEEIARVNGQGNSNDYKFYRYFDRNAASGTNYYRLKQVDYNGRLTTYTTVNSSCSSSVSGELMALVYPNPFNTQLNVSIENVVEGEVVIELFDVAGRKLFGLNEYNYSEIYFRELNIDNLVTGMYYLKIHINGQIITKKLEKK
ncbi:MAG TPA: Ig-like domain-containing protein [Bacteroidales bacterium]|nr:Ig-like domain-containing protein [Bacteroidales bacterium]